MYNKEKRSVTLLYKEEYKSMKRSTKTLMLLCVIVAFILCVAGFVACGNDGNEKKGTLTLDATKKDMTVGTTATITANLQDLED